LELFVTYALNKPFTVTFVDPNSSVHDVEQLVFGDELGVVLTQPSFDFLKEQLHVVVSNFVLMQH
jgi:hypothetical protein